MADVGEPVLREVGVHSGDEGSEHLEPLSDELRAVEELIEGRRREVPSLEKVRRDATAENFLSGHGVRPVRDASEEGVVPVGIQYGQPQRDRWGGAVPFWKWSGRAARSRRGTEVLHEVRLNGAALRELTEDGLEYWVNWRTGQETLVNWCRRCCERSANCGMWHLPRGVMWHANRERLCVGAYRWERGWCDNARRATRLSWHGPPFLRRHRRRLVVIMV